MCKLTFENNGVVLTFRKLCQLSHVEILENFMQQKQQILHLENKGNHSNIDRRDVL